VRLGYCLAIAIALGFLVGGCGAVPGGSASPPNAVETPSPDDLEAIHFRGTFGLRTDLAYVRFVAASPLASSAEFGVPLMPEERTELNARAANADAVVAVIQSYAGAHPDEFAGLYLDQENGGGAVTTLWTGHLDEHADAIRALVRPGARIAFRGATFSERDLNALQDRIWADVDWMRSESVAPQGGGVDVIANRVELEVSSSRPDAAALVSAHYPVAPGMLIVTSDGTGAVLIRAGTVRGRVVDVLGQPPGEILAGQLVLQWTSDGPGDCGRGDVGFGVLANGGFELPCQAGGHTIEIQIGVPNDGWRTIASGHVVAVADAVVGLEIRLAGLWPAPNAP
jgi:hypothetical protein